MQYPIPDAHTQALIFSNRIPDSTWWAGLGFLLRVPSHQEVINHHQVTCLQKSGHHAQYQGCKPYNRPSMRTLVHCTSLQVVLGPTSPWVSPAGPSSSDATAQGQHSQGAKDACDPQAASQHA